MTRSAYQISPIWSDSRLRRSKIRFPRIQDYLRVTRPSQITRDISFPDGSDDGHEERVRGNERRARAARRSYLPRAPASQQPHTTTMASASALAGAFTTLGVSANRAAAKKTNVVAKKVRVLELPSRPNESTRASTSSFPREDSRARRGSRAGRSARLAHPPRSPSTGDRCPSDGDRAARGSGADAPDPFGCRTIVFFTNRAIPDGGFALPRRLERPLTPPRPRDRSAGFLRALGGPLRQA